MNQNIGAVSCRVQPNVGVGGKQLAGPEGAASLRPYRP